MKYLLSEISNEFKNWTELFDVVICSAKKPAWYIHKQPFRKLEIVEQGEIVRYEPIESFEKGQVYVNGNLEDFLRFTGWHNSVIMTSSFVFEFFLCSKFYILEITYLMI